MLADIAAAGPLIAYIILGVWGLACLVLAGRWLWGRW